METVSLNMYHTTALAVVMLYIGKILKLRINFLEKFCIPAPVVGGLLFAIISCGLYISGILEIKFDETLRNFFMVGFFTSIGFQANLKILKEGGVSLIIFLICVILLILGQNIISVMLARFLEINPLVGLCTGSISMTGGHGTSGAFGAVLEKIGLHDATTLCMAAATFGLVGGSLMGGPLGRNLILKKDLLKTAIQADDTVLVEEKIKHHKFASKYAIGFYQVIFAMGAGTIFSEILEKIGLTFPIYIGAMIIAAFMRNFSEFYGKFKVHIGEITDIGGIFLSIFLGIAMITLKLWELADLAVPLIILLLGQTIFMYLFARFIIFNVMGRDYDAAILSAGTCGFGMGATPNAMANMQVLTKKFAPSVKAYLLVPIVGSMFADFINSLAITFFINFIVN